MTSGATDAKRKPLPAFARELADARARGLTLKNAGVSVRLHSGPRPVAGYGVVVGDSQQPAQLDWSWCRALEVVVYRDGDDTKRVMEAVAAIEAARPRRLLVVEFGSGKIISLVDPATEGNRVAA